jgi:hypothetical protein
VARYKRHVLRALALIFGVTVWGCTSDTEEEPDCIELPASCTPLNPATFDNVFNDILKPSCGATTGPCHGPNARSGGLEFHDPDRSHAALLDGRRVKPFDAACSRVIVRTHSIGKSWQMPPDEELEAGKRCMLQEWIAAGAER